MIRTALTALLLLSGAGPALAGPDFESQLSEVRAAVLAQPLLAAARRKPALKPPKPVTEPAAWARLLDQARLHPTLVQDLHAGKTQYRVFVRVVLSAVAEQKCDPGSQPRNTLYVAEPVSGSGGEVYPVRLASVCVGPDLTAELFQADADGQGLIQDSSVFDPAAGRLLNPKDDRMTPAQLARLDAYLSQLVALFLAAP